MTSIFDADYFARLERLQRLGRRAVVQARRRQPPGRASALSGIVFAGHREHADGDDVRAIDWNAYARLERLFVLLREPDREMRLWLALDASASLGTGEAPRRPFDDLRRAVLALGVLALRRGGLVGAFLAGGDSGGPGDDAWLPARRGGGQAGRLRAFLERAAPSGTLEPGDALAPLVRAVPPQRRGVCVVASDFLDAGAPERLLGPVRAAGFDVVALELCDLPGFGRPRPPRARGESVPFRLTDAETGERLGLVLDDGLADAHARSRAARAAELDAFCRRHGVRHITLAPGAPFEEPILEAIALGVLEA